jgi:AraC-like DNA-binding protein
LLCATCCRRKFGPAGCSAAWHPIPTAPWKRGCVVTFGIPGVESRTAFPAYYLQARNPSLPGTLIELAQELGLDGPTFHRALNDVATDHALQQEIAICRQFRLTSFPSLALEVDGSRWPIAVDYRNPAAIRDQIQALLD